MFTGYKVTQNHFNMDQTLSFQVPIQIDVCDHDISKCMRVYIYIYMYTYQVGLYGRLLALESRPYNNVLPHIVVNSRM